MKYSVSLVILIAASASLYSCRPAVVADPVDKYESMECVDSLSDYYKADMNDDINYVPAYIFNLTGFVESNGTGDVYIVVNPESKSRRTYLVTGKLKQQLAAMKGRVVTVKCCYLEKRMWSGTVRVYEILK